MGNNQRVALLPWLQISEPLTIGQVKFFPFNVGHRGDAGPFEIYRKDLANILQSYHEITDNKPIRACTLACTDEKNPCSADLNYELIVKATRLLAFAALSENEYFVTIGKYANSSYFEPVFQGFMPEEGYIALWSRRRDGSSTDLGYTYKEVHFSAPRQCHGPCSIRWNKSLLVALGGLLSHEDAAARRILAAVSYYCDANSDSVTTLPEREIVHTASAFEALFEQRGKAKQLATNVSERLRSYGTVKVKTTSRQVQGTKDDRFLHEEWARELYVLRDLCVHGNDISRRLWGWNVGEHLLMGAFVFPLLVKMLLQEKGWYKLEPKDECRLHSIDTLLDAMDWVSGTWQSALQKASSSLTLEEREKAIRAVSNVIESKRKRAETE